MYALRAPQRTHAYAMYRQFLVEMDAALPGQGVPLPKYIAPRAGEAEGGEKFGVRQPPVAAVRVRDCRHLGPVQGCGYALIFHPVSFARARSREAVLHDAHRTARVMVWDAPGALHAQYLGSPRFALGHVPGKGGREALVSLSLGAGSAKVFL